MLNRLALESQSKMLRQRLTRLTRRLQTRKLVQRVRGILARMHGIPHADAMQLLIRHSRERRSSLYSVSEGIILLECRLCLATNPPRGMSSASFLEGTGGHFSRIISLQRGCVWTRKCVPPLFRTVRCKGRLESPSGSRGSSASGTSELTDRCVPPLFRTSIRGLVIAGVPGTCSHSCRSLLK